MPACDENKVDRTRVLGKATVRAAKGLGLSCKALAEATGLSSSTVYRIKKAAAGIDPTGKSGERALLLVRTFYLLDALVGGDEEKRQLWMSTSNRELNGVPMDLAKKVDGLPRLLAYLDKMKALGGNWNGIFNKD